MEHIVQKNVNPMSNKKANPGAGEFALSNG